MTLKQITVGLLLAVGSAQADANPSSIFDTPPEAPSTTGPKKVDPKPAPEAPQTPAPAAQQPPAAAVPKAPADDSNELRSQLADLQKENEELRARVKELTESLAAYESKSTVKDPVKDKAQQERDARIAAAKLKADQKAENDRLAKIKPGISLTQAETLAKNKAVATTSEEIRLKPRPGYFGPLWVRKQLYTLAFTKGGEEKQIQLAVIEGVITDVGMP